MNKAVMTPMSPSAEMDLTKELTCSLCLHLFSNPVLLRCGHSFCRVCIDGACNGELCCACPTCGVVFLRGRHTAVVALASLVERVRGDSPVRGISKDQCVDHQEKLKLFCKDDGVLLCLICRDSLKHAGHSFLPIRDAMSAYKARLSTVLDPMKSTLKKSVHLKKEQERTIRLHKCEMSEVQKSIASVFEKFHQSLRDRETEVLNDLHAQRTEVEKEMVKSLARLEEDCQKMQDTLDAGETRLREHNPLEFLRGIQSCLEKCSEESTGSNQAPGVSRGRCHHPCRGPFEYMIWKQLKSAVNSAPSWLTLDPDTAHYNLVLSEDHTSVRYTCINWCPPPHPKRFIKTPAVLGSEGFNSGKHYWEVNVGRASAWILGVVEESINKNENVTLMPWNGVWVLQLKGGNTYEALEKKRKVLSPTSRPTKIGVYLNSEEKQLSFYNADDLSHLHTFFIFSSAKLFPYLRPCSEASKEGFEPLTICH